MGSSGWPQRLQVAPNSPINPTSGVVLVIIALSASGAIFLIVEMTSPFTGLMRIPSDSLRNALGVLGP